jgi:ribonuclease HI
VLEEQTGIPLVIPLDVLRQAASKKERRRAAVSAKQMGVAEEERLCAILAKAAGKKPLDQFVAARIEEKRRKAEWETKQQQQEADAWKSWFDGCCEPNPGKMGIGVVLVSPGGEQVEVAESPGYGTNNQAEYLAAIAAMETAIARGATGLILHGDSQLVVCQVSGEWSVNSPGLKPLHQKASELFLRLPVAVNAPYHVQIRVDGTNRYYEIHGRRDRNRSQSPRS